MKFVINKRIVTSTVTGSWITNTFLMAEKKTLPDFCGARSLETIINTQHSTMCSAMDVVFKSGACNQ